MEGLFILALVLSFLPWLVSLAGRGVWKFLSFLCCLLAAIGAIPTFGLSILLWILAWVFTGVAISTRRRDDQFARLEQALLAGTKQDRQSPVGQILVKELGDQRSSRPNRNTLAISVLLIGTIVLGFAIQNNSKPDIAPAKFESVSAVTPATALPVAFVATIANEHQWSASVIPADWPKFTVLPNEKTLPPKSDVEIISAAEGIISRWNNFVAKKSNKKPTSNESGQAISYLLTIKPTAPEYPAAWAAFIRMRKVDAEIGRSTKS